MAEQTLQQKTTLRNVITQQQLRFVTALEKNAREFDQEVEKELEENSALEAEPDPGHEEVRLRESHASTYYPNLYSGSDDRPEFSPRDDSETLYDSLRVQLSERTLDPDVNEAALYLIDSLEPDGYLRRSIHDLREDMLFHHGLDFSEPTVSLALATIKEMDPPGVGAESLQECLALQLRRLPRTPVRDDALQIVENKFEALTARHYHKILSSLKIKEGPLRRALDLIVSLNPRPGLAVGNTAQEATNIVIPDFIITEDADSGELSIMLNNRIPELKISESFESAVKSLEINRSRRKAKTPENQYILSHFNEASDFIKVFRQRQETLYMVMSAIVKLQKEYFETADIYSLHPMMLKDLERETGLDKSTISRATKNKFVDLPWGTYPLKFFFSDSKGSGGKEGEETGSAALTNRKIEAEIRKIVDAEDKKHPLSDAAIFQEMQRRGLNIARRTVTKYRERCGIPASRLRRR
ncbi:MAG: RNA polymerase factor sigma-54 [Muribaculaceae bacterium]|nr:RNA polymerase factor sigma-54 [Muribaculaceae bacterium]